jgi:putative transposase
MRYIHLNPLRAGIVEDLGALNTYAFSGHGVILGKHRQPWQHIKHVLAYFD